MATLTGKLLVASPVLVDPNFDRTVVYVCAHSETGAFGLVLNRPIPEAPVGEHLPAWMEHVRAPVVLFRGGPVEQQAAFGLAQVRTAPPAEGWLDVAPGIGLIDLGRVPDDPTALGAVRVFSGYAGWSPGQLEGEIDQDAWFVVDADGEDLFREDPENLWRDVLIRQEGKLAMYAFFPREPNVN